MSAKYFNSPGGMPTKSQLKGDRAIFTDAYAVIPHEAMRDIVTSFLPNWENTRAWVLARPLSGFAETFSYTLVEISEGGGSSAPEPTVEAEAVLFVAGGEGVLRLDDRSFDLMPGSYVYLPAGGAWSISQTGKDALLVHWVRKAYEALDGGKRPEAFHVNEADVAPQVMPHSDGKWSTTRFVDPEDLRHDMHVNIVNFLPSGEIPFAETHVMEHGIYILEGQADYYLNGDWVHCEAGDFLWLRAFCPQACIAKGDGPFRYLLYKDVNRHMPLSVWR
ncbi:MAG: bifunctional allantoicase/(S)-ureidoglycine aminohydrolase [Pseudomonadota bacterium]